MSINPCPVKMTDCMGMSEKPLTVLEAAWLTSLQVVLYPDKDGQSKTRYHGSGFFFDYQGKLFVVTADHVANAPDWEEQLRDDQNPRYLFIYNYIKGEGMTTLCTYVGQIYQFDIYDLSDPNSLEIPDLIDVAFAVVKQPFERPFLSSELVFEGEKVMDAGQLRRTIVSDCVVPLQKDDECMLTGRIGWHRKGTRMESEPVIYEGLRLEKTDKNGNYILKSPYPIRHDRWETLSGSPVFTMNGRLVGMLIQVNENDDTITVVPMHVIMRLMDYAIVSEGPDPPLPTSKPSKV